MGIALAKPFENINNDCLERAQEGLNSHLGKIADAYFETHQKPQSLLDYEFGVKAKNALIEIKAAGSFEAAPPQCLLTWYTYELNRTSDDFMKKYYGKKIFELKIC